MDSGKPPEKVKQVKEAQAFFKQVHHNQESLTTKHSQLDLLHVLATWCLF